MNKPQEPSEPLFPRLGNGDFPKGFGLNGPRLPHGRARSRHTTLSAREELRKQMPFGVSGPLPSSAVPRWALPVSE